MAPKKAPKKAAKKAPKKHAKKAAKHASRNPNNDLRRAFEHLGRLEVLQGGLTGQTVEDINALIQLARAELESGETRNAAELLRACEHLAFGHLASGSKESGIGHDLQLALEQEFDHIRDRASHHADANSRISSILQKTFAAAETAYTKDAFRRAMELIRACDALSHVDLSQQRLAGGVSGRLLKS